MEVKHVQKRNKIHDRVIHNLRPKYLFYKNHFDTFKVNQNIMDIQYILILLIRDNETFNTHP